MLTHWKWLCRTNPTVLITISCTCIHKDFVSMATFLKGYWYNTTMPVTYRKLLRCDHVASESSQTTRRQQITHNKKTDTHVENLTLNFLPKHNFIGQLKNFTPYIHTDIQIDIQPLLERCTTTSLSVLCMQISLSHFPLIFIFLF